MKLSPNFMYFQLYVFSQKISMDSYTGGVECFLIKTKADSGTNV